MKKLLILPILAMSLFACNMASQEDYDNMAKDMCGCVEESLEGMSDRGKQIMEDSDGDDVKMQEDFMAYMIEDSEGAEADMMVLEKMQLSLTSCGEKLEKKYDDVYSNESEDEIMKKLVEAVNNLDDGCKITKILINAGYEASK